MRIAADGAPIMGRGWDADAVHPSAAQLEGTISFCLLSSNSARRYTSALFEAAVGSLSQFPGSTRRPRSRRGAHFRACSLGREGAVVAGS